MLRCPECRKTTKTLVITGSLVTGKQQVNIDGTGKISNTGPIIADVIFDQGKDLLQEAGEWRGKCPHCRNEFPLNAYNIIAICVITGKEADVTIAMPRCFLDGLGPMRVAAEAADIAKAFAASFNHNAFGEFDNFAAAQREL